MTPSANPRPRSTGPEPAPRRRGVLFPAILLAALGIAAAFWWFSKPAPPPAAPSEPAETASKPPPPTEPTASIKRVPAPAAEPIPLTHFPNWTTSTNAQLIARLLDASAPLKDRRQAARALARIGSDEAIAALKTALLDAPPYLKAAIGEGLGQSPNPQAKAIMTELAEGTDEIAARGAIRGFALRDDADSADTLAALLLDPNRPESVRTEAALALGDIHQPGALSALTRAANDIQDETLVENILQGLGKRPFSETQDFFRNYLQTPNLPVDSKVAALEALGNSEGDVAPFLVKFAADPDPEVREAAAWTLSTVDTPAELGPQLLGLLKQETDPEVRTRLYQALANQAGVDAPSLLALAQQESNPGARLAGLAALAQFCNSPTSPDLLSFFNQTAVPELKNLALTSPDLQDRLASVAALGQSGTADATVALQDIARQSSDPKTAQAAQNSLSRPPVKPTAPSP